tara:strand:- start:3496 stop:4122 length:627 start_codon:yes stop_codon:yes gene_type:complete
MFDKDTSLIFEAYQVKTLEESKMKDIATAIEMGDDVDDIIKDLKLDDTESVRAYITKERDDYYEKGERPSAIDTEDMESNEEGEPEEPVDIEKKERERAGQEHARAVADHYEDDPEEEAERCPVTGKLRKKSQDDEDKTGDLSDDELLKKVKGMGTAGDALIKAAEERLKDGMSLTAHERDALGRDAYGDAEKEIAKESVSYTTKYII